MQENITNIRGPLGNKKKYKSVKYDHFRAFRDLLHFKLQYKVYFQAELIAEA